jgi:hypothetical protein
VADDVLSFIIVSWTPEVCICVSLCKVDSPHNYGGVVQKLLPRLGAKLDSNDRSGWGRAGKEMRPHWHVACIIELSLSEVTELGDGPNSISRWKES